MRYRDSGGSENSYGSFKGIREMKKLLAALLLALPLVAATETASVTVPNAQAAGLFTLVEAWIQGRTNDDGSLKYDGATIAVRRQVLFDAILRDGVRRVVRQACSEFPTSCPDVIKTTSDAKMTAETDANTAINDIAQ